MAPDRSSSDHLPPFASRDFPAENAAGRILQRAEFTLELPSDLQIIESTVAFLADWCRSFAFSGPRLSLNFRVGITEALANAVLYGNEMDPGKRVRVEARIDTSRITIRVEDEGHGFDPAAVPDPTLPENLHRSGGRGLFLIRELMDEVEFSDDGNSVRLVLLRDAPRSRHASGE